MTTSREPSERTEAPPTDPGPTSEDSPPRLEVGWIIAGRLDEADNRAVRRARAAVLESLRSDFPEFTWQMPLIRRPESVTGTHGEPVVLLENGTAERDAYHWDFAILVTQIDLVSHYKPFALGIVSRSHDTALISTARIDPSAVAAARTDEERVDTLSQRVAALALHAFGHLNGLTHDNEPRNRMFDIATIEDIDRLDAWTPEQIGQLRESLMEIADVRLEERARQPNVWQFYLQSAWINRGQVLDAVREARPWEFPVRLSRLTTAAVSATLILMITAETWELASVQRAPVVVGLAAAALAATTAYVVRRQQLLVRRDASRLSEQSVISNLSTIAIVLGGMATTMLFVFAVAMIIGTALFRTELVSAWTEIPSARIHLVDYIRMAALVTTLSTLIGALGVSFEDQHHFRHITFVDEEI